MLERELSKALNVSRISVRNAISKLVVIGLLWNIGRGREHLYGCAAVLAARRAAPGDIQFMEKSLDEMKTEINEGRTGTEAGRLPLPWRRVLPGMPPYSS